MTSERVYKQPTALSIFYTRDMHGLFGASLSERALNIYEKLEQCVRRQQNI